jgi:hypothetical protein
MLDTIIDIITEKIANTIIEAIVRKINSMVLVRNILSPIAMAILSIPSLITLWAIIYLKFDSGAIDMIASMPSGIGSLINIFIFIIIVPVLLCLSGLWFYIYKINNNNIKT